MHLDSGADSDGHPDAHQADHLIRERLEIKRKSSTKLIRIHETSRTR